MIALALTYILRYIPLAMSEEAKYGFENIFTNTCVYPEVYLYLCMQSN